MLSGDSLFPIMSNEDIESYLFTFSGDSMIGVGKIETIGGKSGGRATAGNYRCRLLCITALLPHTTFTLPAAN